MTQEEKELLMRDLGARLSYGVKVEIDGYYSHVLKGIDGNTISTDWGINYPLRLVKPYLRPVSSMTEKEKTELRLEQLKDENMFLYVINKSQEGDDSLLGTVIPHYAEDWANKNHFDYRGLIQMGLALEASEDMYKIN